MSSKDCSFSSKRATALLQLWEGHAATGGAGKEALQAFYHNTFISKMPGNMSLEPLERTVGKDAHGVDTVVDEFMVSFTHSTMVDWMLPGIEPTSKQVSVPFIVVVKFKGDKLSAERIYWDQATVLRQIGVLQPTTPATTGGDQAKKMADFGSVPSNGLINAAAQG
uniref:SnoaL-like domain-containing protein n=1 Tax=Tetradesmus obliquus TaxID=3088 RepID=A0A383W5H5_TETOB|eukprot:jgi/Sobl393_1/3337/SZX72453.1